MRIGLVSDTHDRLPTIERAIDHFNREEVDITCHLGDFVSPFSLLPFQRLAAPLYAVFGNNDGEKEGLRALFEKNGWSLGERPRIVEVEGFRIGLLHEPGPIARYVQEERCDLVAYGHLHAPHDERQGKTMIVNPGEGCGWITGEAQVAIVDLVKQETIFTRLDI